jgi:hypothetical protein
MLQQVGGETTRTLVPWRGVVVVIQQGTSVWVSSPSPFQQYNHFFETFPLDVTKQNLSFIASSQRKLTHPHQSPYTKLLSNMAAAFFYDFMSQPSSCIARPDHITQGEICKS